MPRYVSPFEVAKAASMYQCPAGKVVISKLATHTFTSLSSNAESGGESISSFYRDQHDNKHQKKYLQNSHGIHQSFSPSFP